MGIHDILNDFDSQKNQEQNSKKESEAKLESMKKQAGNFIKEKVIVAFTKLQDEFKQFGKGWEAKIESTELEALLIILFQGKEEYKYKVSMAVTKFAFKPVSINYCRNKNEDLVEEPRGTLLSAMYPNMMSEANIRNDFYRQYKEYMSQR
jgi:hypothetical protein